MRNIIFLSIISLTLLVASSCNSFLDINDDPNYPTTSSVDLSLSSSEVFITSAIGGDLQLMGGIWSQHYAQHTGSNQYTGIDSYNLPNSSSYVTRSWGLFYAGALPDLENAINLAEKNNEWSLWFIAKTLKAFSFHILVDFYGEIPFSQATQGIGVNPKYDNGRDVNQGVINILNEAIDRSTDAKNANKLLLSSRLKSDLLLNCDINTWIKFAKTLKLKILLRDYAANKIAIDALLVEGDLLTTDIAFTKFEDKENNSNPLYENDRRKLNTSNNLRASSTLVKYLLSTSDPRLKVFFEPNSADTYEGLPQGGYTLGTSWTSRTSRAKLAATDTVYFMSAAESHFLQAECLVLSNKLTEAKIQYDLGVTAAFQRYGFNAATFIETGGVYEFNTTSQTTMLQSIWRQKWIAATRCQAWDSFFEINRTGYPVYGTVTSENAGYVVGQLAPSINTVLPAGEFPRRLLYPKTSVDFNPNAPVTVPMQTKMWWHK